MHYQNYEDYMRSVLGYPINDPNVYESYDYRNMQNYSEPTYSDMEQFPPNDFSDEEMMALYPDIYKMINPMVCKVCETNTQPITKDLIERMTDEVYLSFEDTSTVVNVRSETPKSTNSEVKRVENTRTERTPRREEIKGERVVRREEVSKENRVENNSNSTENRQSNFLLRDLIKILILNQLLRRHRPPMRPHHPPFPGGPGMPPPRPPFPGGGRPPMGPGPVRPPIQPRDYQDYLKF